MFSIGILLSLFLASVRLLIASFSQLWNINWVKICVWSVACRSSTIDEPSLSLTKSYKSPNKPNKNNFNNKATIFETSNQHVFVVKTVNNLVARVLDTISYRFPLQISLKSRKVFWTWLCLKAWYLLNPNFTFSLYFYLVGRRFKQMQNQNQIHCMKKKMISCCHRLSDN